MSTGRYFEDDPAKRVMQARSIGDRIKGLTRELNEACNEAHRAGLLVEIDLHHDRAMRDQFSRVVLSANVLMRP